MSDTRRARRTAKLYVAYVLENWDYDNYPNSISDNPDLESAFRDEVRRIAARLRRQAGKRTATGEGE